MISLNLILPFIARSIMIESVHLLVRTLVDSIALMRRSGVMSS
ncbi:MAG: hypothetical protein Q4Q58_07175 [Thermoplasmata archaeon]|nr:hypothetical protein [Thermoplasmata archaeon]